VGIPNMITMLRIVLTPLFVRFYLEGQQGAAMAVLFVAAMSDMLDGFIARRFHMITPLGKVLDPVADKLLQLGMLLCLADRGAIVWLLLLLHLMRQLLFVLSHNPVHVRRLQKGQLLLSQPKLTENTLLISFFHFTSL